MDDPYITEAFTPPKTSPLAYSIFSFLQRNHQYCIIGGGLGIMGIDKDKLERLASRRGIELERYDQFVDMYLDKALRWLTRRSE